MSLLHNYLGSRWEEEEDRKDRVEPKLATSGFVIWSCNTPSDVARHPFCIVLLGTCGPCLARLLIRRPNDSISNPGRSVHLRYLVWHHYNFTYVSGGNDKHIGEDSSMKERENEVLNTSDKNAASPSNL